MVPFSHIFHFPPNDFFVVHVAVKHLLDCFVDFVDFVDRLNELIDLFDVIYTLNYIEVQEIPTRCWQIYALFRCQYTAFQQKKSQDERLVKARGIM